MTKTIYLENLSELKQVKQLSTILLGLSEIENLEADLDEKSIKIDLNVNLGNEIIKYYIKTAGFNIVEIVDEK